MVQADLTRKIVDMACEINRAFNEGRTGYCVAVNIFFWRVTVDIYSRSDVQSFLIQYEGDTAPATGAHSTFGEVERALKEICMCRITKI